MKNYLHTLPYFLIFLLAHISPKSYSQCLCSDGAPATAEVHTLTVDSITAINSTIDFPKFNPATGTLFCLQLSSNITTVINLDLYNKENFDVTYRLESFRRSQFTGPGGFFSTTSSPTKSYGPYLLGPVDPVGTGDEIQIGPDTVFNSLLTQTNYNSNMSLYMGTGNVSFGYLNTSTTTLLQGSSNYDLFVRAYTRFNASLTYYWCPNSLLATNIKNFSAIKKDKNILLKWATENTNSGNAYEIEFSHDGRSFNSISQMDPKDNNLKQHEFQFHPSQSGSNKLYFRIKQIDAFGKVTYSPIRIVDMNDNSAAGFIVYPNPVSRKVSMQFDRSLNGNYIIELTSLAGQVMYNRNITLNNSSNVQFDLTNPPPAGIYYLKITDTKSKLSYTNKLFIKG